MAEVPAAGRRAGGNVKMWGVAGNGGGYGGSPGGTPGGGTGGRGRGATGTPSFAIGTTTSCFGLIRSACRAHNMRA